MAVPYAFIHARVVWHPPDVLVICVSKPNHRLTPSYPPGAHSRSEHRPQVLQPIFFFVHIANIPEELREDLLHGHRHTQTHTDRHS